MNKNEKRSNKIQSDNYHQPVLNTFDATPKEEEMEHFPPNRVAENL
jgi:hypothetical protein